MKEYLKQHWFEYIFAFVLTVFVAIVVTVKFGYVYSTNDDVMLRNIISGNFTGDSESHVINVMFISGLIWKFLYNVFPNVSWYDLSMIGLHYLCWFLIIVRVGQQCEKKKNKVVIMLLFTLLLCVIDLKYLIMHQYTILTTQLVSVSVFWIFTSKVQRGLEYWLERIVIVGMLTVALWLRKEAFLLAAPVFCLAVIYEMWKLQEFKGSKIKNILIYVSIFIGIFLITYSVEEIAYSSVEWSDFQKSHAARIQIYDYTGVPGRDNYFEEYENLDIDMADWMAIYTYNCELAEDFNADKMVGVAEISLHSRSSWRAVSNNIDLIKRSVYPFCTNLFNNQIQPIGMFLVIAYLVALFLCYKQKDKKTCTVICLLMLFYMVVFIWLIDRGRVPERVVYGMYFMQLICLFAFIVKCVEGICHELAKDKFWLNVTLVISIMALGTAFIYSWQNIKDERNGLLQNADDWKYVNDYFVSNPEKRYCIDTESFIFSTEKLFAEEVESDNLIRLGSWMLNSPLQQQRMENQGVEDLVQQLAEDENFYIVQEEWKTTEWIDTIWQGKGYDVEAVVVDVIATPGGRTFEVIQMQ